MRILLTIILNFSLVLVARCQTDTNAVTHKPVFGLKDLTYGFTETNPVIVGQFVISNGFGGYSYTFDSSGFFTRTESGCSGIYINDSGVYRYTNNTQIEVVSKTDRAIFDIVRFEQFVFLISPGKRQKFRTDFLSSCRIYNNLKKEFKDPRYTSQFLIAFSQVPKYLTKGID